MRWRDAVAALAMLAADAAAPAGPAARPVAPWRIDPFPSTYRPGPQADLLITDATILDGAGRRIDHGAVLVRGGRIAAVAPAIAAPSGARVIDAHGRWVTPGIIDVHSHDGTYVEPLTDIDRESSDVSEESDSNAADTRIETAINVQDTAFYHALENGVTTLQVLPGSDPIFGGHTVLLHPIAATTVAAMKVPGAPQGFKMACGESPKSTDAEAHRGPTSRQGEIAYIRAAFLDAAAYRADWDRYAAGKSPVPPKRDLKREALAGILAGDVHVDMHCYRSDDMATMLSVAHEAGFRLAAFHHAMEAYKIPALLRDAGTCAAVWSDWWGFKMEALDGVRAEAPMLDRAGVCVTMHSDSPAQGQRLTLQAAKAAAAGRAIGIDVPPERMIRWLTGNAARMLGMADRIGMLAPGLDGDLVLWSGNPFSVYSKADLVLIDGAVAYDRSAPPAHSPSDFELGRTGVARP